MTLRQDDVTKSFPSALPFKSPSKLVGSKVKNNMRNPTTRYVVIVDGEPGA